MSYNKNDIPITYSEDDIRDLNKGVDDIYNSIGSLLGKVGVILSDFTNKFPQLKPIEIDNRVCNLEFGNR